MSERNYYLALATVFVSWSVLSWLGADYVVRVGLMPAGRASVLSLTGFFIVVLALRKISGRR